MITAYADNRELYIEDLFPMSRFKGFALKNLQIYAKNYDKSLESMIDNYGWKYITK